MKRRKITVHINCSPWLDGETWNISTGDKDYFAMECHDCDTNYEALEQILDNGLDKGTIHSYYIHRSKDPKPFVYVK